MKIIRIITSVILLISIVGLGGYLLNYSIEKVRINSLIENYEKPTVVEMIDEHYDVIVIRGEPEGVAAAVSAARNGSKTLLIEERSELGGLFTYGMLNFLDIPRGEDGKSVSKGIFKEWHDMVKEGKGDSFNITAAKAAFKKLIDEEPNITLLVETQVLEAILENNTVTGVKIKNQFGETQVTGTMFIDATQDADFATLAGVPYFVGGEDIGIKDKKMAVTLMIHLKDVDWNGIEKAAASKKFGEAETTRHVAWGFEKLHEMYEPIEENTRLRGLNIVKSDNDYYINALQIFDVDGLDEGSKHQAIEKGKKETEHILSYLQAEFPGFENAKIASFPTELYVRETRHIWAEYQLAMSDVWTNRDHWDNIGYGAYPVDVQAQTIHDYGYVLSNPTQYAIPFRSLVPQKIDGLLVVGRSTGFSSLAAGSARVVPTGMVTGQAAGAAATLAIKGNLSFRELSQNKEKIEELRDLLVAQGAFVDHTDLDYPYKGEWYDRSIQTLMDYGLIVAGYSNDLKLDEPMTKRSFVNLLSNALNRVNPNIDENTKQILNQLYLESMNQENESIQLTDVISILAKGFEVEETLEALIGHNIINEDTVSNISNKEQLLIQEGYVLIGDVINCELAKLKTKEIENQ